MSPNRKEQIDLALERFLNAKSEEESNELLERLIAVHALPLIRKIIRSELDPARYVQHLDDIAGEVVLSLIRKLRLCRSNGDGGVLSNFSGYIAVTSYNACHEHLRKEHPERSRLKKRLRYVLNRQKGFALWADSNGEWICGFDLWQLYDRPQCAHGSLQSMHGDAKVQSCANQLGGSTRGNRIAELLAAIFDSARGPIRFDDLVAMVAELLKITDKPTEKEEPDTLPATGPVTIADEIEQRGYLQRLWAEIRALPLDQRRALLLNLRDEQGDDMVSVIVHGRIANIRQIAELLAIPAEEFAVMFIRLPLDDLTIGELLGTTRQRVINLRKAARRRLARRMSKDR